MKPKVAVIGAGVMGKHHATNYVALPGAEFVGFVEPDEARRVEVETQFHVPAYKTLDALLRNETISAASVAAPTSIHYDLTKELLNRGVHVLVEKPVATDVEQARELAEISRQLGLVMQVGHITRFFQGVQLLNDRVKEPYLIEAKRMSPYARIQDVGVILDLMIHDIDIVLGLVSADVKELTVAGHTLGRSSHEDVAAAQISFENGCIARFLASRIAPAAERTMVIDEPHQTTRLDATKDPYTEITVYKPSKAGANRVKADTITFKDDNPLRNELEHFLHRIRNDADPIGTLEDDLRSLSLATELLDKLEPSRKPERILGQD